MLNNSAYSRNLRQLPTRQLPTRTVAQRQLPTRQLPNVNDICSTRHLPNTTLAHPTLAHPTLAHQDVRAHTHAHTHTRTHTRARTHARTHAWYIVDYLIYIKHNQIKFLLLRRHAKNRNFEHTKYTIVTKRHSHPIIVIPLYHSVCVCVVCVCVCVRACVRACVRVHEWSNIAEWYRP